MEDDSPTVTCTDDLVQRAVKVEASQSTTVRSLQRRSTADSSHPFTSAVGKASRAGNLAFVTSVCRSNPLPETSNGKRFGRNGPSTNDRSCMPCPPLLGITLWRPGAKKNQTRTISCRGASRTSSEISVPNVSGYMFGCRWVGVQCVQLLQGSESFCCNAAHDGGLKLYCPRYSVTRPCPATQQRSTNQPFTTGSCRHLTSLSRPRHSSDLFFSSSAVLPSHPMEVNE